MPVTTLSWLIPMTVAGQHSRAYSLREAALHPNGSPFEINVASSGRPLISDYDAGEF